MPFYFCLNHWVKKRINFFYSIVLLIIFLSSCNEKYEHPFPEAEKQKIDGNELAKAFDNAKTIDDLQGLAVARNNVIVAEEYFSEFGSEPDSNLHVMSVTKSISSTLVGIAIDKGFIQSVDQIVSDYLGAEVDAINPDLGKVTIHQLLTMTNGHNWHELGNESEFNDFISAPDKLNYILQKPIVHTPGTIFNYSDGTAHLISVILSKATGMDASAFADQNLFEPMGLGDRVWYGDNRKFSYGGFGLCLGIHDMIKIGFLYLNDGFYNNQQIVSSEWIDTATRFRISTNNVIPFLTDYGYFWWIGNAHNHNFICANGYGGQFIFIVKELNLVVCSRTNYRGLTRTKAEENWYAILDIIINQILPAVKD